jgi:hypothetical protein
MLDYIRSPSQIRAGAFSEPTRRTNKFSDLKAFERAKFRNQVPFVVKELTETNKQPGRIIVSLVGNDNRTEGLRRSVSTPQIPKDLMYALNLKRLSMSAPNTCSESVHNIFSDRENKSDSRLNIKSSSATFSQASSEKDYSPVSFTQIDWEQDPTSDHATLTENLANECDSVSERGHGPVSLMMVDWELENTEEKVHSPISLILINWEQGPGWNPEEQLTEDHDSTFDSIEPIIQSYSCDELSDYGDTFSEISLEIPLSRCASDPTINKPKPVIVRDTTAFKDTLERYRILQKIKYNNRKSRDGLITSHNRYTLPGRSIGFPRMRQIFDYKEKYELPPPVVARAENSKGPYFFYAGFFCPVIWIIGSHYLSKNSATLDDPWRRRCKIASITSAVVLTSALILILVTHPNIFGPRNSFQLPQGTIRA